MIIHVAPTLIMLIGAAVYALSTNPKAVELGRLAFFAGLFVLLFNVAGHELRI